MEIWFISDTHFAHEASAKFRAKENGEGFNDSDELDAIIIENWNKQVQDADLVYHLGDFCFFRDPAFYFKQLKGHIHFVEGNHDRKKRNKILPYVDSYSQIKRIQPRNTPIVLCHYPLAIWQGSHWNDWHLFGHIHDKIFTNHLPKGKKLNVNMQFNNYKLYNLDEIEVIMNSLPNNHDFDVLKKERGIR